MKGFISNGITLVKRECVTLLYYVMRIFPIKNNKIVISNYAGNGYGDEGKYIYEALGTEKENYDIVWLCKKEDTKMPQGIRCVKYLSLKSIYEQATAKIWIDNRRKPGYVRKRKEQYYIHTWHGGGPCLKMIEKDAVETLNPNYVRSAIRDSKMANVMVSGSDWRTKNMKESFWFSGEILKCDLYYHYNKGIDDNKVKKNVYSYFNLKEETHILLYAPTFRKNENLDCYDIDYERLIKVLEETYGGKWVIILRLHPNIADLNNRIIYTDEVLNGSLYPQIVDLIIACNFMITDYSGCMFKAMKLQKRVLIYASDYSTYTTNDRGMYFDIRKLPAPYSENMDQLLKNIQTFNDNKYEDERSNFIDSIGYYDDIGPELVASRIKDVVDGRIR